MLATRTKEILSIGAILFLCFSLPCFAFVSPVNQVNQGQSNYDDPRLFVSLNLDDMVVTKAPTSTTTTTTTPYDSNDVKVNNNNNNNNNAMKTVCDISDATVEFYEHDGFRLSYQYKPASPGYEDTTPLLLIHPVGIGLSSWFWNRLLESMQQQGPAVYAVNLIGCGIQQQSAAWKPEEKGLFFPLSWAQQCEKLINDVILPRQEKVLRQRKTMNSGGPLSKLLSFSGSVSRKSSRSSGVTVVTQGGLAPVGVVLASRNPNTVSRLLLASPPPYDEMITPIPEQEMERNYRFFKSKVLGGLAFSILESRPAVEFFSNLFLFQNKCDSKWLDLAMEEACVEARPPVQAFNSGLCLHRSLEEEMTTLQQPVCILQGTKDVNRIPQRELYETQMVDCVLETLPGLNVLPWESPDKVRDTIFKFIQH